MKDDKNRENVIQDRGSWDYKTEENDKVDQEEKEAIEMDGDWAPLLGVELELERYQKYQQSVYE